MAMRRRIIAPIAFCAVCLSAPVYFGFALWLMNPPSAVGEKPRDAYRPIFRTLSPAQRAHILDGEFSIEREVDRLPDGLKSAFSRLAGEHDFKMANPGEKYQATDVVDEAGLPFRRLLFAGISSDKYFIHYEKGGYAPSNYVVVFGVDPGGKVRFLWGGAGPRSARDLKELRAMVAAGVYADGRAYYW